MANALDIMLHPLGEELAADAGDWVDIGETRSAVVLRLFVSAAAGDKLVVYVETSDDQSGAKAVGNFGPVGAGSASRQKLKLDQCGRYVRVRWTLGTSATFSVAGKAHTLFAQRDDVTNGSVNAEALQELKPEDWAHCLLVASAHGETAAEHVGRTPLTEWSEDFTQACADIAAWLLLKKGGIDPNSPADELVKIAHDDAKVWLHKVIMGGKRPKLTPKSEIGAVVTSGNPAAPTALPKFSNNWGDF